MAGVTVPYKPRDVFKAFHKRNERFAVGVAHRRCGKTVACINDLIKRAVLLKRQTPPGRFGYTGPQLNQSKDNVWQYLKFYAAPLIRDKNEQDLWVELVNGARVRLYGADNPDRIRGAYFDHVIMDEYADMAPSVWGAIVRPMLADYGGGATFIGTPKGRNAFFELYDQACGDPEWFTFLLPASETGILPEKELASARRDMTPEQYEQEFECSFEAAILGAYFGREMAEAERTDRICDLDYDPEFAVHTAWDLGVGDSTVIWFFQVIGESIHVIDHYEAVGMNAAHYVQVVKERGYQLGSCFVPHDGKQRSWTDGDAPGLAKQRVETLIRLGLKVEIVADHKIMDGINAVRMTFPRFKFDRTKCRDGIEALRQYRADYDEKTRAFRNAPKHDWTSHSADAARYMAMGWRQQLKPQDAGEVPLFKPINKLTMDEYMQSANAPERRERV